MFCSHIIVLEQVNIAGWRQAEGAGGEKNFILVHKVRTLIKNKTPDNIEGACHQLIKDRMDITGARWSMRGAEAVLRLRSLYISGDWDKYWRFHLQQEHKRNHLD